MTELATLQIKVDASGAIRVVDQFGNATEQAARKTGLLESGTRKLVTGLGALVGGGAILSKVIAESNAAQAAQAQLEATLRSTGGAAGQTAEALNAHAAALQRATTFGDDAVTQAQALLLTFTRIGGDTFPQATEAVLNVATAMGGDLRGAAIQVGKALNDPVLGLTALSRSGIQFTEQQKALITSLVETNRVAEAQRIILAELETQFGGSAVAARDTLGGAITSLNNAIGDLFEMDRDEAAPLIGAIEFITDSVTDLGLTWKVTFAEMQVAALKLTDQLDQRFLGALERTAGSALLAGTRGAFGAGLLARGAERRVNADNTAAALETYILELQRELAGRGARGGAGRGAAAGPGPGSPGAPPDFTTQLDAAEFSALVGDAIRLADATAADARVRLDAQARQQQLTGEFNELIGETGNQVINFGDVAVDGLDTLAESARVFQEQSQLALAAFASDFLKDGFSSVGRFWDSFAQLGRDAIGNLFAKSVMDRLGGRLGDTLSSALDRIGLGGSAGVGLAAFGMGLLSAMQGAAERAEQIRVAMAESARSILGFSRRATDDDLTAEQRALRDLLEERDTLARNAVAATGIKGFSGGYDKAVEAARVFADLFPNPKYDALLDQLLDLGEGYRANAEAIRENIAALEEQRRAQQAATLEQFRDSLALSGASTLSPVQQLAEARRQYEAILGLAQGGDASAIDSLPETARTLLDAARAVFASGTRYADEFARVNADVADVIATLAAPPPPPAPVPDPEPAPPDDGDGMDEEFFEPIERGMELLQAEQAAQTAVLGEIGQTQVGLLGQIVARLDGLTFAVTQLSAPTYGGGYGGSYGDGGGFV